MHLDIDALCFSCKQDHDLAAVSSFKLREVWVYFLCLQICLARACGGAYVTALCLLTALGVAFFSILRTKADPGSGILSILGYLISILTGEFTWPARVMWRQVHPTFLRMLLAIAPEFCPRCTELQDVLDDYCQPRSHTYVYWTATQLLLAKQIATCKCIRSSAMLQMMILLV